MDLTRAAAYRVESSPDGNDLTVVFDEPVDDPIAALKTPGARGPGAAGRRRRPRVAAGPGCRQPARAGRAAAQAAPLRRPSRSRCSRRRRATPATR